MTSPDVVTYCNNLVNQTANRKNIQVNGSYLAGWRAHN